MISGRSITHAAGGRRGRAAARALRAASSPRSLFSLSSQAADHDHEDDQRALDDLAVVRVDALEDHDRATSVRQNAAATGPAMPPLPPARLTPPSTTAATEFSVMKLPEYGLPMPLVAVARARPARRRSRRPRRRGRASTATLTPHR